MDPLTAFGLVAVSLMLVFYTLERRSRWCVLGFAAACAMGSVYGFLQGAWPFGIVESIWALVALRRWQTAAYSPESKSSGQHRVSHDAGSGRLADRKIQGGSR